MARKVGKQGPRDYAAGPAEACKCLQHLDAIEAYSYPQKAKARRKPAIKAAFREEYGEANCKGLDALLLTDYMSQDCSDYGNISSTEWQNRCAAAQDSRGLETVLLAWRSSQVRLLTICG